MSWARSLKKDHAIWQGLCAERILDKPSLQDLQGASSTRSLARILCRSCRPAGIFARYLHSRRILQRTFDSYRAPSTRPLERKPLQVEIRTSARSLDFCRISAQESFSCTKFLWKDLQRIVAGSLPLCVQFSAQDLYTKSLRRKIFLAPAQDQGPAQDIFGRLLLKGSLGKSSAPGLGTGFLDRISWQDLRAGSRILIC